MSKAKQRTCSTVHKAIRVPQELDEQLKVICATDKIKYGTLIIEMIRWALESMKD